MSWLGGSGWSDGELRMLWVRRVRLMEGEAADTDFFIQSIPKYSVHHSKDSLFFRCCP